MPETTTDPSPSRPRTALKVLVVVLIVILFFFGTWHFVLMAMIQQRISMLRSLGVPTSCAGLNAYFPTPPRPSNAALIYEAAAGKVIDKSLNNEEEPPSTVPGIWGPLPLDAYPWARWSATRLAHVQHYLQANKSALDLAETAAQLKDARYSIDYAIPQSDKENVKNVEPLIDPIRYRAEYAAEVGDTESAIHWMSVGWSFLESLGFRTDPPVEPARALTRSLNRVLLQGKFTDEQLARLGKRVDAIHLQDQTDAIIGYQTARFLESCRQPDYGLDKPLPPFFGMSGLAQIDELKTLDLLLELQSASRFGLKTSPRGLARTMVWKRLEEQVQHLTDYYPITKAGFVYNSISGLHETDEMDACIVHQRIAIAAERYWLAHSNQSPASAADLVPGYLPAIPIAPDSGLPFRLYHPAPGRGSTHTGYVIARSGYHGEGCDVCEITMIRPLVSTTVPSTQPTH